MAREGWGFAKGNVMLTAGYTMTQGLCANLVLVPPLTLPFRSHMLVDFNVRLLGVLDK